MKIVGALIIFGVIAVVMIPLIWMLWKDRPKRVDNYQNGDIGGGDGVGHQRTFSLPKSN
jgi:hypothetical protein